MIKEFEIEVEEGVDVCSRIKDFLLNVVLLEEFF